MGEPGVIARAIPSQAIILELGCGAGRITHPLVALGYRVTAVDSSREMIAQIRGAETVIAAIEGLDLGRTFDAVLLASHLINTPDAVKRVEFMRTCRRHVALDGIVVIQRHDTSAFTEARAASAGESNGIRFTLSDVNVHGRMVDATATYETADATWSHAFCAELLDDDAIESALNDASLRLVSWLDSMRTWFTATPMADS